MSGVPFRLAALAVGLLSAVGLLREAYFHCVSEPIWRLAQVVREPRPETRYAAVRAALPASGRVGYLSDLPVNTVPGQLQDELGTWLYQQAQYALSPLVLVYGDANAPVVLANVKDPAGVDGLARAHGLRIAALFDNGRVAVLRR